MKSCIVLVIAGTVFGFKLASKGGDKFMTSESGKPMMSSSGTPLEFSSEEISPSNNVIKDQASSKVLDLSGGGKDLILWSKHGGWNQQFSLARDQEGSFYLMNGGKCMEIGSDGYITKTACSSKNEQKFEVVMPKAPGLAPGSEDDMGGANPHTPQIVIVQEKSKHHRGHGHGHSHGRYLDGFRL